MEHEWEQSRQQAYRFVYKQGRCACTLAELPAKVCSVVFESTIYGRVFSSFVHKVKYATHYAWEGLNGKVKDGKWGSETDKEK